MMSDQAHLLRQMVNSMEGEKETCDRQMHIITVASGKGGVGKSNFSVNLALSLKALGKNPIILDADFGLANVEIILGEVPKYNLSHLIKGQCEIESLITPSKYGVSFISGGSGVKEMNFLSSEKINHISHQLSRLNEYTDVLIIDTGAGINDIVVKFCDLADQVYVVVTPEPTSITDGYALMKTLLMGFGLKAKVKLVINKAESQKEAHDVYNKLNYVCHNFLNTEVDYAGFVPYDEQIFKSVKAQVPIYAFAPHAKASTAYYQMARLYLGSIGEHGNRENDVKESWINKFKRIFGQ